MGRLKRLNIITTDSSSTIEDHEAAENQSPYTSQMQVRLLGSQEYQPLNNQVTVTNKKERTQSLTTEVNGYEKIREFTIQENRKRLEELGIKNIANSMTSLAQSQKTKKKTVQHPNYISPMSTDRVANLKKLRRVMASNFIENARSTSIATKQTTSEIVEGSKGRTKKRMVLIDEDDFEDDDVFEGGNTMDDVAQDEEQHQNDILMVDRDCVQVQEELQISEKEKATGVLKKGRGHTQKAEIWKMGCTERICVTFDKFGQPVGDEGRELVQYLGTLVRMGANVSIEYSDWRKVPMQKKEDMYSLVKSKFTFHPVETSSIKKWILFNMGKKWRTWKCLLKSRAYDPSLTIDEIVTQQTNNDERVNAAQFKELVTRWFTSDFQNTCAKKRTSRSKMKEPHVTGTKSFARLAHEMAVTKDGVYPTRGEVYINTRTRKDGSIVDDVAVGVVNSLKAIANDSTSTPGDQDNFANDDYSKVKGQEKRGYVRMVGRMPTTKTKGDSQIIQQLQSATQTINQLQSAFGVMMNVIQDHIPNANLSTILSNMNVQVPRIASNDESSRNTEHEERGDKM